MAHELTRTNGKYEFAYTGEAPWHGLGQRMPDVATMSDIMKAAGLEWIVVREPMFYADGTQVPGSVGNRRSDTKEHLGVVSDDYKIVQNGDAFAFVDQLAQSGGAKYHTAGSIRRGRQVFATAKLPQSLVVLPNDVVDQYLLLVNAHDGSLGFHLRWTPIRVVCNNTLTAAINGRASYQYTVRHVGDLSAQLREASRALGVANRYFDIAGQAYRALAARQLSSVDFVRFLDGFLPIPVTDASSTEHAIYERDKAITARDRVQTLFETGVGTEIAGVPGTAWGAYNAATEWIDRVRTAKKDGTMKQNGAEAAVLGVGQDLRDRAMSAAIGLLN